MEDDVTSVPQDQAAPTDANAPPPPTPEAPESALTATTTASPPASDQGNV